VRLRSQSHQLYYGFPITLLIPGMVIACVIVQHSGGSDINQCKSLKLISHAIFSGHEKRQRETAFLFL
jgi:hypothetical protein